MFKLPKLKIPTLGEIENILLITIFVAIIIIVLYMVIKKLTRENYVSMNNGGIDNKYENQEGLYKKNIGVIGTRKQFGEMRKPFLNPILVPVIKGKTE